LLGTVRVQGKYLRDNKGKILWVLKTPTLKLGNDLEITRNKSYGK
jgi:hypothetical protein